MHRAGWQWLVAMCALWVAGCTCGKAPVESELAVSFERPVDGQRLALEDDADTADGFQYDMVAVASDTSGRAVTLASAKLELQVAGESTWHDGPAASLDGARASFPKVTLPGRTVVLRVTVEEQGSKRTATHNQSVTVGEEAASVDIASPEETQVLREADDADPATPGYQVVFKLHTTGGLAGRKGSLVCGNACGIPGADFTVAPGGVTEVPVNLSEASCEAQVAECYAVVHNGGKDVGSARRTFSLDTVGPRVELSSPVAPVSSTTFKVEAVVGCCEDGSTATLTRDGQAPLTASISGGVVSFSSVTVPAGGRFPYTLRATDSGGNPVEYPIEVLVAPTPYTLALSAPGTVTTDADGDPSNGIQVDVTATTNATDSATVIEFSTAVTSTLGAPVRVATNAVAGGRSATFRASLAEGSNAVRACVSNPALAPSCQTVAVNVSTARGSCRIVSPLPGAAVASSLLSVKVETGASTVTVRARDASGAETSAAGTVSGGSAQVDVSLPSEGAYQLVATCGASGVSQALTVTRDTTRPDVLVSVSGEGEGGVLGPQTRDTSAMPGTQVIATVTTEPLATVKLTGCDPANSASAVADTSGTAVLREVTVPRAGNCTLQVTATDVAGNVTVKQKVLTLGLTGSQVAFVAPSAGRALGSGDGTVRAGGGLTVDVQVSVSAGSAGELKLFLGTVEVGSVTLTASTGPQVKVFSGVELNEGANVLRASLTSATGQVACATELLTVDTQPRTLTLISPTRTAPTYNLTTDRNVDLPGIQAPLQYALAGASADARVDICTSVALKVGAAPCRDGSTFFTLATDVPAFVADFTYPDGEYSLKAVLNDASFSSSESVSLVVDSVRPRVTRLSFDSDTNGDGELNLAEQSTGAPVLTVAVTGLEDGRQVQVRDATSGLLYGQSDVTGGLAHVALSGLPNLVEARYSLVAAVFDKAGNGNKTAAPSALDPLNSEAFTQFRLDRLAPTLDLVSPSKTRVGLADDADPATGFQLALTALTSADVGTGGVVIQFSSPAETRTRTPNALKVSELFTVPESGTTDYTFNVQATDEAGNSTSVTRTVTVDFDAPTLTPMSPVSGDLLHSSTVTLRANVTGAEGQKVSVYSVPVDGSPPSLAATLTVGSDGVAVGTGTLLSGVQDVRFDVSDAVGNAASATVSNVTVTAPGCDQRFTSPSGATVSLTQKDDVSPATPDLQYRIKGVTSTCKGRQVRLFRGSATDPEAVSTADALTGAFGFDVTLPDGATTTLRLEMDDGVGTSTSVSSDITVDITPPVIVTVVPADTTLFYVADSNEAFFRSTVPSNYIKDLSPDGDAEAKLSLHVTGALNGSVSVVYNGADLVKPAVVPDSDDKTFDVPITLPHGTTGTLTIVVRDALGNETRRSADVTVDVRPPAAPVVNANVVAGAERTASVAVNWTSVSDDGTDTASGNPAGYDLRWTTDVALPGGITTDALYFTGKVKQATGAMLPSTATSFTLTPLPPLTSYSLQLRARDEVGNYSRIATPVTVNNLLRNTEVLNPGSGAHFAYLVASNGNLDGTPGDDLVVASYDQGTTRGAVYVYSGADLFPSGGGSPTVTQTLLPPDTATQYFGIDLGIGNVGDAAGEGLSDLLVGASGWSSNLGRAFLYFGRPGAGVKGVDPTPIEFRGTVTGGRLGVVARIIGDINGDGLGEVVFAGSYENSGAGRMYLFYGRSRAQWDALKVDSASGGACTVSSTSCHIPASKADRIFTGETPPIPSAINTFGRQRSVALLGDITGDGYGDLLIPASRDVMNRAYIFSGKAVSDATGTIAASSALQTLTQTAGTDTTRFDGFGTEGCANVDLVGGSGRDLVLSHPYLNRLLVYADGGPTGFSPAATLTIQGANNFGNGLACADINGDGRLDIVAGTNVLSGGSVWLLYNQASPGSEFEPSIGGFSQGRLTYPGATALGVSVATGDFNGDGRPDIAAGDNLDARGARVEIWY